MENKENTPFSDFIKNLITMFKFLVFLFLVQLYWEAWIGFYRDKKWLYFGLMSILPTLILYYLIWDYLVGGAPPGGRNPYTTTQY